MAPISKEALLKAINRGEKFEYVLFYGHEPSPDGRLSDSCFSQWWPAPFELDGLTHPTAEHWMMAAKARLFGDDEILKRILAADSPYAAKKLGRQVRGFDDARWKTSRFELVVKGNVAKFSSTPELKKYLLDTGDAILVEASPRDTIWGIGLSKSSAVAEVPSKWRGLNLLGFALVSARELLRR